ncbi:MAG: TfoX/Sxy family protein [Polyangiales bacterium]
MPVSESYRDYVLDQLSRLQGLTVKRMFAGYGIYAESRFFAIVYDDTLFLRVNDATRPAFVDRKMPPFHPVKRDPKKVSENYYQCPAEVLDDTDELTTWATRALRAAATPTAAVAKRQRSSGKPPKASAPRARAKPRATTKAAKRSKQR